VRKLILLTVDTDLGDDYMEDALFAELVLKLRPFVPGETAELHKLRASHLVVIDVERLLGKLEGEELP
jgi:hypothetical protein